MKKMNSREEGSRTEAGGLYTTRVEVMRGQSGGVASTKRLGSEG